MFTKIQDREGFPVNPAKEDGNLADVKASLEQFTFTPDGKLEVDANITPVGTQNVNIVGSITLPVQIVPAVLTWQNGTQTVIGSSAVQIIAANSGRKGIIVQNTGSANIRIGLTGVTASTGFQLFPGGSIAFSGDLVITAAVFGIREGSIDSTAYVSELS